MLNSCCGLMLMPSFELDRGQHAKRGAAELSVVSDLEKFEDRDLVAGLPALAFSLLDLHAGSTALRGDGAPNRDGPTQTHPTAHMPARPATLPRPSPRWPRTSFWVDVPLQQLGCPAMDRQLGLELAHALVQRNQFGVLSGRHARFEPRVDARLVPPRIDPLAADPQPSRDCRHRTAALNQIDHTPPDIPSVP